ncbi:hypothetical protein A4A71_06465 [Nicoletella semolina]|nr:hypothetical protein [Nicoletella semolina]
MAGFLFSLLAITMWGTLPIVLQVVLKVIDAQTIVWFRFVVAAMGLFLLLYFAKKLPNFTAFFRQYRGLWVIGVIGLSCNFFLFNLALKYIPAAASQVISPISTFVMVMVGVVWFKETFGVHQKIGFVLVVIGLGMFFNNNFSDFAEMNAYAYGILLAISASLIWIGYSISQKLMLAHFNSQQILLMIYFGCAIVFTPTADLSQMQGLTTFQTVCLIYCGLNTVIAYGSYAEALNRWEVSKVSLMMTLIPVMTLLFSALFHKLDPEQFPSNSLNFIGYMGAIVVVMGAMLAAVGHKIFYRYQLDIRKR